MENFQPGELLPPPPIIEETPPQNPPRPATAPEPEFTGIKFQPDGGNQSAQPTGEAMPVDEKEILSFISGAFDQKLGEAKASTTGGPVQSKTVKEIMPPGMIAMSAEMLHMVFAATVQNLGILISGNENGNYAFNREYAEVHKKALTGYMEYQNVHVTPGQLLLMLSIVMAGGSGFKAYRERKARIKIEQFNKNKVSTAKPGAQLDFGLDVDTVKAPRKNYRIDKEGFYETDISGRYAKKEDREKAPLEYVGFINSYFAQHQKWPTHKEMQTFLNFN